MTFAFIYNLLLGMLKYSQDKAPTAFNYANCELE